MRRNWIQFNTRGPRACRQAHCRLLACLASLRHPIICQICVCVLLVPACMCVCVCLRACTWLEKPEPLLESGHDLAVTHRNRERRGRKTGERRQQQQQQQKPRRWKTSWSSCHLGAKARQAWWVFVASLRSFHRELSLLFIRAPALLTGRSVVEGKNPS